tara:strand:+ start:458 stop:715 length:258 start_codon:yes stop_codon:yes gene_type:complete
MKRIKCPFCDYSLAVHNPEIKTFRAMRVHVDDNHLEEAELAGFPIEERHGGNAAEVRSRRVDMLKGIAMADLYAAKEAREGGTDG